MTVHVPLLGASQVHGTTEAITGQFEIANVGGVDEITAADVSSDLRQLRSGNAVLDRQVALVLQTDRFPTSEFHLTQPATLRASGSLAAGAALTLHGELTLQGVSRPSTYPPPSRRLRAGYGLRVVGAVDFLLSQFGVSTQIAGGLATVDDDAIFEFSLLLVR